LVISKGGKRVLNMIKAEAGERGVACRADDSKLARLLFDESMEEFLTDQWALRSIVCDYYKETQLEEEDDDLPEPEDELDDEVEPDDEEEGDDDIARDLLEMFAGKPRPSAQRGAEWALERVQCPPRGFLVVPPQFTEADLENFLWVNWERIDFGFDRPIYLVGRQKCLSTSTSDRVDFLAKGRSGEHIAIELKIGEAKRGDYTQLVSYMGNLESSGVRSNKVRGVLIASSFSQKVLNSASTEPRVALLRFRQEQLTRG
jgi:hypothetical protein